MSRPEHCCAPEIFYNETEAKKYTEGSRMVEVQTEITRRCIEMLRLPEEKKGLILDVGCGTGLSGAVLENLGHAWIGIDISRDMLDVANNRDLEYGDLCKSDMGTGLPFRFSTFDGCISVSALQWLCYAESKNQDVKIRLLRFFSSLYTVLKKQARAVFQFYPEDSNQAVLIATSAVKAGFTGGIVVDYPNSAKAKKYYLCLSFERSYKLPVPLQGASDSNEVQVVKRERSRKKKGDPSLSRRDMVIKMKEKRRLKGLETRPDTKYTGRKRKDRL